MFSPMLPSLFLEATQRKTAPTGRFVGHSGEKAVVEVQVAGIAARRGRRPAITAEADFIQPASGSRSRVAEARDGGESSSSGAVPLGTRARQLE